MKSGLKDNLKMSQAELARRLGVPYQYIWRVLNGKRVSPKRALEIERASDGQITRHMLLPDLSDLFSDK